MNIIECIVQFSVAYIVSQAAVDSKITYLRKTTDIVVIVIYILAYSEHWAHI